MPIRSWLRERRNHIEFLLFIAGVGLLAFGAMMFALKASDWALSVMGMR